MYYIYVLWEEDSVFYKIGVTVNIKRRQRQIQSTTPHKLRLIKLTKMLDYNNCIDTEYNIKQKWSHCRVRPNSEWYILDHKQIAGIERYIDKSAKKAG